MSELEERGPTWCKARGTAQNRVRWRTLVEDYVPLGMKSTDDDDDDDDDDDVGN